MNEAHKQYNLSDTIFNHIFDFGPPGKHLRFYTKIKQTYYMSAGVASQCVIGFGDLSIDVFLDAQNQRYSQILYLLD